MVDIKDIIILVCGFVKKLFKFVGKGVCFYVFKILNRKNNVVKIIKNYYWKLVLKKKINYMRLLWIITQLNQ